jgi:uncharacterized Zn finger protein
VAERRRQSDRETRALRAAGKDIQPVIIKDRLITRTFWGKAWCAHLESYSDYSNRLPRGRTYVRNGSVCHLEISKGTVRALVRGTEMYTVEVDVTPLGSPAWGRIREKCTGRVASLLDLLSGKISSGVMEVVTDRDHGMFPAPREIRMSCSCPDVAVMCKHVAAVLYGVGARFDERPELLFVLRGVDHEELIAAEAESAVETTLARGSRKRIAESDLAEVFGVEIDAPAPAAPVRAKPAFPAVIKAKDIRALRARGKLTVAELADKLGVSAATVRSWEKSKKALRLQPRTLAALRSAWRHG